MNSAFARRIFFFALPRNVSKLVVPDNTFDIKRIWYYQIRDTQSQTQIDMHKKRLQIQRGPIRPVQGSRAPSTKRICQIGDASNATQSACREPR